MGASVGIGGLIVGVAMLVVFSMAYQSIAMQIDSGLDRIENAETPIPAYSVDDATLWEEQWSPWTSPTAVQDTQPEAR